MAGTKMIINVIIYLIVISFITIIYFGFIQNWIGCIASICVLAMLLFFVNSDKMESFKASTDGIEVKTRELKQVVDDAKATLKDIQDLAKVIVGINIDSIQRQGRLGGYTEDDKDSLKNKLFNSLKELKIDQNQIEKIMDEHWHNYVLKDYTFGIIGNNVSYYPVEMLKRRSELVDGGFKYIASPDEVESFLEECRVIDDQWREYLKDYRYYAKNKKHRRLDVWANRDHWHDGRKSFKVLEKERNSD